MQNPAATGLNPGPMPLLLQLLDTLRQMIGRSPALAVALVNARLVDTLLSMLIGAAPILRVKVCTCA